MDQIPPRRSNVALNVSLAVLAGVLLVVVLRLMQDRREAPPAPALMAPVASVPAPLPETTIPGPTPQAAAALEDAEKAAQDIPPPPPPPPEDVLAEPPADGAPHVEAAPGQPEPD